MSVGPPHASDEGVALVHELRRRLVERVGEPDAKDLALDGLSAGERALFVLLAAADHVQRGGFEQFFYFLPDLAPDAPASAELVKARRFQRLFEQANAVAFGEPARKRARGEFRRMMSAVEASVDSLARLDDEFDALMAEPESRVEAFLARYVQSAPHEFADLDGDQA